MHDVQDGTVPISRKGAVPSYSYCMIDAPAAPWDYLFGEIDPDGEMRLPSIVWYSPGSGIPANDPWTIVVLLTFASMAYTHFPYIHVEITVQMVYTDQG